jgi:hypothetical protein
MTRTILTFIFAVAFAGPAVAQSAVIDLSTPMTGKSIFAVDHEGRPVERGVAARAKDVPEMPRGPVPQRGHSAETLAAANGASGYELPSGGDRRLSTVGRGYGGTIYVPVSRATGDREKTVAVRGHTRSDGTEVKAYNRSAPRRGGRRR